MLFLDAWDPMAQDVSSCWEQPGMFMGDGSVNEYQGAAALGLSSRSKGTVQREEMTMI